MKRRVDQKSKKKNEDVEAYRHETETRKNAVPVIALSTRYLSEEVDQTVALGVSEYLAKATTSPNILCSKVNKILSVGLE